MNVRERHTCVTSLLAVKTQLEAFPVCVWLVTVEMETAVLVSICQITPHHTEVKN